MRKLAFIYRDFLSRDWVSGLLLTFLVLGAFCLELSPLMRLEYASFDAMSRLKQEEASSSVAVVSMERGTSRSEVADTVKRLTSHGAKVIAVDVLYPEEQRSPGLEELRALAGELRGSGSKTVRGVYRSLKKVEKSVDADGALVSSVRASGRVLMPLLFSYGEAEGETGGNTPRFLKSNSVVLDLPAPDFKQDIKQFRNPMKHLLLNPGEAAGVSHPFDSLARRALALGHVNYIAGPDGVVRGVPLFIHYRGRAYPSFALQAALSYLGGYVKDAEAAFEGRSAGVRIKKLAIPTDDALGILVGRAGPEEFPVYTVSDVLEGKAPAGAFKRKLVFVGPTEEGPGSSGVLTAANAAQDIINEDYLVRPAWAFGLEVAVMAYFGIFIALILPRVKLRVGALVMGLSLLPWLGISTFLFYSSGYWVMAASPSFLLLLGYGLSAVRRNFLLGIRRASSVDEGLESRKMLGLTFQSQGMLDMAFEKFMKLPVRDDSVKELLYNLALDFERKRMPAKAKSVYEHILKAGRFRDVKERAKKLGQAEGTMTMGGGGGRDATLLINGTGTKPTLGRYEVLKELGRGAMGTVYLGRDPKINREVAIKTLVYEEVEEDQLKEVKKRFFQEAEAAGRLSHPNIMTIYDAGEDHDLAYMAMELLSGDDLTKYCGKGKLLPHGEVMRIIADVAGALEYAHNHGVVHRDIKPANIMLLEDGTVKVTDFGIARVVESSKTNTGTILGTPSYMSPEQVAGEKVGGPSDLFSLGAVFYELLSGQKAFKGDSIASIMYNISQCDYVPLKKVAKKVPRCCEAIVTKLLARTVTRRYKTGEDVANDIVACMAGKGR